MKRLLLAAVLVALLPSLACAATLFLVRHADDFGEGRDPLLTGEGLARAEVLAEMLEPAGIEFVLSSDFHRTRDTAAAVAARCGVDVEIYDPRDLPGLVGRLRERGGRGLIVGHSNTTPALVELLGGEAGEPIDEMEFDRLYVVHTGEADPSLTIRLRYGPGVTSP